MYQYYINYCYSKVDIRLSPLRVSSSRVMTNSSAEHQCSLVYQTVFLLLYIPFNITKTRVIISDWQTPEPNCKYSKSLVIANHLSKVKVNSTVPLDNIPNNNNTDNSLVKSQTPEMTTIWKTNINLDLVGAVVVLVIW